LNTSSYLVILKMKTVAVLICLALVQNTLAGFLVNKMSVDDETLKVLSLHNANSDVMGTEVVAKELRNFMTRDHVKIVVDKGDVVVRQTYPNEGIPTGHSCSKTAQAMNVVGVASMLPNTAELSPEGVVPLDEYRNAIAVSSVGHSLQVDLDVRVTFGSKVFGHCHHVGRKTCHTNGRSEGKNKLVAFIAASNSVPLCIAGQTHLVFDVHAEIKSQVESASYAAIQVGKQSDCNLGIFGSMNSKIQQYAQRYVSVGNKFTELRSNKLLAELENKLGAKLGSQVQIPLTHADGTPRAC